MLRSRIFDIRLGALGNGRMDVSKFRRACLGGQTIGSYRSHKMNLHSPRLVACGDQSRGMKVMCSLFGSCQLLLRWREANGSVKPIGSLSKAEPLFSAFPGGSLRNEGDCGTRCLVHFGNTAMLRSRPLAIAIFYSSSSARTALVLRMHAA